MMNRRRRQRRRARAYLDSLRGQLHPGGCSDCAGYWSVRMDDRGQYMLDVFHAPGCPAFAGLVPWKTAP